MKCMICGNQTKPSVPLCFCDNCRVNRKAEIQVKRAEHAEWFRKLVVERDAALNKSKATQSPETPELLCSAKEVLPEASQEAGATRRVVASDRGQDNFASNSKNEMVKK